MDKNQIMGGLLGVLIGDALGLPVQFAPREERKKKPVAGMEGWGAFNMPPGSFSDDGSLTLCLAESICEAGLNAEDAAGRFLRWYNEGYWTPTGFAYDIGGSTSRAMERLRRGVPAIDAGPKGENDNGNGSLMRIMPAALYLAGSGPETMADGIWTISRITHGHPRTCSACYIYALLAKELLTGVSPIEAYQNLCSLPEEVLQAGIAGTEKKHFARILDGQLQQVSEREIRSSGYVVHTLEAAIWCLINNNDFTSTLLAAVNLGEDTDTVAAVTGGLAGISYGFEAIPAGWLEVLIRRDEILSLATGFADKLTQVRDIEAGDKVTEAPGESSKKRGGSR
ncbi:MAG: ADP-ribosylglycohydrolase family protein [Syntrophomonas sp.]|uniref:ADP-ribosylglycohydrolase family protein n=1 Tax=Syntrophomonas sp. TaxID=2053627 RepID=UPI0026194B61|nr:ADP-ribosylglycohydrolase family protein [Syntrophomonas sp.]MDD2509855.1 ADP-ribosylglycohydrolase family protein [Syntrophomonas sp.]MDD3879067.1 ADP-ribosylglycohydrolase family protein [Syntrophomonas sp.]MDD4627701.1 ADP-ribosylglycohydrolase family protein [Syntrophomonas sp.]